MPTEGKNPHAVSLGQKGGRAGTAEQRKARKRNLLRALIKRHPTSVKIRQQLRRIEAEEARERSH